MDVKTIGDGSLSVGVVGSLHGNETIGKRVIDALYGSGPFVGLALKLLVANERAIGANRRFVESDLNRSFPGKPGGTAEERLASAIKKEVAGCDFVIDIHSTRARMPPVIITTARTRGRPGVSRLVGAIPIGKVVVMGDAIAGGRSLIDHVKAGASIEVNERTPASRVSGIVERALRNLRGRRAAGGRKRTFEVAGFLEGNGIGRAALHNFVLVRKGRRFAVSDGRPLLAASDFYPVFVGEKEYGGKLCMVARETTGD